MSRFSLSQNYSNSPPSEMPSISLKSKDLTWDPNTTQELPDRRHSSLSANPPYGESTKYDDDKLSRTAKENLTMEDRVLQLERELAQLNSTTGVTRTLSEYDHEQISELDFARYTPKNEITRISPDDWHEKKGAKFATPEVSVLTVCNTSRHWAGRIANPIKNNTSQEFGKNGASTGDVPLTDIAQQRPYRLAICGFELHRYLERTFKTPVSLTNNVWIWPFKPFITYEAKIRQDLVLQQELITEMKKDRLGKDRLISLNEADNHIAEASLMDGSHSIEAPEHSESSEDDRKYAAARRLENQLRCLVQFMDEDMEELFSVKKKISDGTLRNIAFDFLWLLFQPGDLIFTSSSQRRAYTVLHVTGGRAILDIGEQPPLSNQGFVQPIRSWERHEDQAVTYSHSKNTPFLIDTFYIDFDGDGFGPVPRRFVIQEFEGEHPIDTLPAFPAELDKDKEGTKKMLNERGARFVKMASVAHKKYSGLSAREPSVADWQEEVNSDVVIDFAEAIKKFRKDDPSWEVGIGCGVVDQASRADRREINEIKPCATKGCTLCKQSDIYDDSGHDLEKRVDFLDNNTSLLRSRILGKDVLPRDQVILLPPRVYGYSLLDRFWYPLNIDNVEDIRTSTHDSFDDLVLPGDHKRVMQALVKHHSRGPRPTSGKSKAISEFSADLVRGKGRGLIILLHGVPGVGKTSTAECVAAQTKRPLFPITCGDIGTTPSEVEKRLEQYFDLAHKWGCVLLLDEADVYLATREKGGDLQRNSLVSVFLRVLEYYSGILILTTNRVGEFDEAFKSRIHVSLYYPRLDGPSTIKIWKMNLSRIERSNLDIDIESDSIIQFCEDHWVANKSKPSRRWNGRQIKNAFQTAIALATWDFNDGKPGKSLQRPKLTDKHFSIVSQTSAHFDDYLSATHQIDDDETYSGVLAEREGLRNDNVPKINWGGHEGHRGSKRELSIAKSKSPLPRNGRYNRIKGEISDNEEGEEDDGYNSGDIEERTDMVDDDDAKMRALEQELQRMKRRKSSTKSNRRGNDEEEEADMYGRSPYRRGKTTQKESSRSNRSNLAPETRSRREVARMEENSEEEESDEGFNSHMR